YLSPDDGRTWTSGLLLEARGCSYPDGTQAHSGTVYIIYDRARRSDKLIMMTRFTEKDIIAGKFISPRARAAMTVNQASGVITEAESWQRLREQDGSQEKLIYTGI